MPTRTGRRVLSFQNPFGGDQDVIKTDKVTNGSSVKNWRHRLETGQDCSTSYGRTEVFVENVQGGTWFARWKERPNSSAPYSRYSGGASGVLTLGGTIVGVTVPTSVENSVKSAFLSKMDATRKSLSGITVLGELGQTVKQLLHPMAAIRSAVTSHLALVEKRALREYQFLRKRPRARRRTAQQQAQAGLLDDVAIRNLALRKAATGSYLEFVFGIQPTLADARAGMQAASRLGERAVDTQRISAAGNFEFSLPKERLDTTGLFNIAGVGRLGPLQVGHVFLARTIKVEGRIRYSGCVALHTNRASPAREEFGFMPRDFIPDIWNCLPWSWLFDYVFDVGSALQAITASYHDLMWCNRAVTWNHRQIFESDGLKDDVGFDPSQKIVEVAIGQGNPSAATIRTLSYARSPVEASVTQFMPVFAAQMPGPRQLLNVAAVLHQQVSLSTKFRAKRSGPEFSRLDVLHTIR
jgi:hypothetical protein